MLNRKEIGYIAIVLMLMQISMLYFSCTTLVELNYNISQTNVSAAFNVELAGGTTEENGNLSINEIMADNDKTISDANGIYSDWIELFNAGDTPLNLSGMYLTDSLNDPTTWQFPNGTFIEPRGFLLIWADGSFNQDGLDTSFGLNANGDSVALIAADGATVVDSVTFKKQIRDVSYGRFPDGGSEWYYLTEPTPGLANVRDNMTNGSLGEVILLYLLILAVFLLSGLIISRMMRMRRKIK